MDKKERILIFYDYFFPGYKAGGPVQSLTNLIVALQQRYSFSVITTAYDLMSDLPYADVAQNSWNTVSLPKVNETIQVWYAGKGMPSYLILKQLILQVKPTFIYINGIYSFRLFLLPILISRNIPFVKTIVCPRGMLQMGALSTKLFKKTLYLKVLLFSGLMNKIKWHATSEEEKDDIVKFFPKHSGIAIAYNIPKVPYPEINTPVKKEKELRLVYLSLIAEKKNLFELLTLLVHTENQISLDIYGPIKDKEYWSKCKVLIDQMPDKVKYRGEVLPINVQQTIADYHALVLLTKGENFGHALYESLSVGRPIITSFFTPWTHLKENKAGLNIDIKNREECKIMIENFSLLGQDEYDLYCKGAHQMAVSYFKNIKPDEKYNDLFQY